MEVEKVIKRREDLLFLFWFVLLWFFVLFCFVLFLFLFVCLFVCFVLFCFVFLLFTFENDGNLFWVYQNGNFSTRKKHFTPGKKSG